MPITSVSGRLARAAAALAATGLLVGAPVSAAPAQAAEPVVTVTASPGLAFQVSDCKGASDVNVTQVIHITVIRTGDTTAPLVVDLSYGGSLAVASGLPAQVTIPDGAAQVELAAAEATGGDLTIAVVDGDGYAPAPPNLVRTGVTVGVADLGCNLGDVSTAQTIEVGTTPAAIDLAAVASSPPAGLVRSVEGTAPPGTTYHLDGTWDGVATQVGTYSLREFFCEADGWCPYRADISVTVVPATDEPPTVAPDPGPTPSPAQAAVAVAATPKLTG